MGKQYIFDSVINWLKKDSKIICLKPYFNDLIYLIEILFPERLTKTSLDIFHDINDVIQESFCSQQEANSNITSGLLTYFSF